MSDYLSNLVSKTLNPTEAVQPRLASLFEPQHGIVGHVPQANRDSERQDLATTTDEIEPLTFSRNKLRENALASRLVEQPPPLPRQVAFTPVESRQLGISRLSIEQEQQQSHSSELPLKSIVSNQIDATPSSSAIEKQTRPLLVESATQHNAIEQVVSLEQSIAQPVTSNESVVATATEATATKSQPILKPPEQSLIESTKPLVALEKIIVQPQVMPYVEPVVPVEPTATPAPTPTIQVTIGRIEIRAMPPAASSSQKQRNAPPVMSLDEYLRQRNQGGSR
ncbi:hypothetical protein [Gloeocapsopsis dulcis]|uniref:Uncharacterized protein n=1 Tax=Gloeocapsopsis dulcis AAB1 = 1H9 TaxID=1433147 RepID=A0A6N8FPF3_9CHRO|nr:hypothetical protein [Gloeocapsopsis dulcis]MUL34939.1 hypothetical protein [Gloeocapsopsis dulcis AAB1 = 1H9]WNN89989.1 hypothetical protein P0S91_02505 [Gloeocapsopsis dulcis]